MKQADRVTANVEVAVDRDTAFRMFTEEIDAWWERGPHNFYNGGRAVAMRFEPGVGGRYLEVYDDATGDALEIGRITVWEPGSRLVWRCSLDDTEIDVRFEATAAGGTRVMLEQRLVPDGTKAQFYSGWTNILGWYGNWTDRQDSAPAAPGDVPRILPVLHYRDAAAAATWLMRAFGLRPRNPRNASNPQELALGDSMVMLRCLKGSAAPAQAITHSLYVYVDNLDEHFAQAQAAGASIVDGIKQRGDRSYVADDLEGRRWTFAQARPARR